VIQDLAELKRGKPTVLTIGAFDGVHRGHQYLIRQMVQRARSIDADAMVITFDPRPLVVLRPGATQISAARDKARVIGGLGPDVLAIVPFTRETSQIPAGEFLQSILDHVNLAEIWTGSDFVFGHNREGTIDFLISAGQKDGFAVHVLPRQRLGDVPISSTAVRELITAGDVAGASQLLGHYPSVAGPVVAGHARGAGMGYPTANLAPLPYQILPATGIYAGYLRFDDRRLPAAASVGYNPVFGGKDLSVEAFVLDFSGDLRGKDVSLEFVDRLRDEQNFASVDALISQMDRDVQRVRQILAE
jgi:riboflavin kinase/FMN adenylyltransferase